MTKSGLGKPEAAISCYLSGEHLWQANIPIGMAILSEKSGFLRVNRALCRFLGYSKKELLGKTVRDITHPDERDNTAAAIRKLHSGDQPFSRFEKRFLHRSGKVVWGEVNSSLIDVGGRRPKLRITQVVDITKRKEAEEELRLSNERFRIALAGSSTMVFTQDREFHYTWAYNPLAPIKVEDFIGKTDSDLFSPNEARNLMRIKREVMKKGVVRREEIVICLFNHWRVFDAMYEPLRDARGKIEGVICAAVDITQRKRMEALLQEANNNLERKIKDRTAQLKHLTEELVRSEHRERRRIADILHEHLQQQLCGMKFQTCHLRAGSAEPATISLANRLIRNLDQTIHLTRTLSTNLYPQVLSLQEVKGFIEWLAADAMNNLGLDVRTKVDARLNLVSLELRMFVFDAVRELLLNVSKHSKVKKANVRVSLMAKGLIKIQVNDAGVGYVPKQNHGTTRHIGLFRIQERAESLGGRLEGVSQPGKGTCATLILPRKDIHSA